MPSGVPFTYFTPCGLKVLPLYDLVSIPSWCGDVDRKDFESSRGMFVLLSLLPPDIDLPRFSIPSSNYPIISWFVTKGGVPVGVVFERTGSASLGQYSSSNHLLHPESHRWMLFIQKFLLGGGFDSPANTGMVAASPNTPFPNQAGGIKMSFLVVGIARGGEQVMEMCVTNCPHLQGITPRGSRL